MKIQLHKPKLRYATIMAASAGVILLGSVHTASAQTLLTNIFGGSNSPGAITVSSSTALISLGADNTAIIGPGFSTTVGLTAAVADTLTASINPMTATTTPPGSPGALTISETSAVGFGVLDVGGHFSVNKSFTGVNLAASTPYSFTLLESQATQISLLSGLTLTLTAGTTTVYTGSLTSLIGGSGTNTLTVNFTTPSNLNPTGPLQFALNGTTTAGVISNPLVFTGGTLNVVPEPGTWAMLTAGLGLLLVMQRFRFSSLAN